MKTVFQLPFPDYLRQIELTLNFAICEEQEVFSIVLQSQKLR